MPIQPLKLRPGIDIEMTPVLNEGGWSSAQLIRFREGLPEKVGGWQHINQNALVGTGRGIHAWADLLGNPYAAVGTEQRLELFDGGLFEDITPRLKVDDVAVAFTTVSGQSTVTVTDAANGAVASDWVDIVVYVSVGGLIIQGLYQVTTVIDANNYVIDVGALATSSVVATGAVSAFTTIMASANISVALANHGLSLGSTFNVQVATTVGGITLAAGSSYPVTSVTDVDHFVIAPGAAASSSATVSENGGNARIGYLIHTGLASATVLTGYGIGDYGAGDYGLSGTGQITAPLRQWFLDNWGEDLIGNYTASPIYVWVPPPAFENFAIAIDTTNFPSATDPPVQVNVSFVALPQQMMIALGVDPVGGGTQDPNLVRFCDVADFTQWTPTAINQAGSYRIPSGSRLVGGLAGSQFNYIWTDIDFWLMNYLSFPLVWGFQKVGSGCGLIAARAAGIFQSRVYWCTLNQFMVFDGGSVQILPCPVWDFFFNNLDRVQQDKVFCAVNSLFGEIVWYFPSQSGDGECDSYVAFSVIESQRAGFPIWYYGMLPRTCWTDDNVYGPPLATDTSGNLQQHEVGTDADGVPMLPSVTSGYITISDGTLFTTIRRLIPDMTLTGGTAPGNNIFITLNLIDYPGDTPQVVGPFSWSPTTPQYILTMCRGRLVSITISSASLGVFWRLGGFRYEGAPAGRR